MSSAVISKLSDKSGALLLTWDIEFNPGMAK